MDRETGTEIRAGEPPRPHEEQGGPWVRPPDPATATDHVEFVTQMKAFRVYKGERPLRDMAKVCARHPRVDRPYSYASFSTIGSNGKLPKRELVCAYIAGCGGTDAEIEQWVQAHTRLCLADPGLTEPGP